MSRIRIPIEKPILHWWIECTEKDPNSAMPTFYYTANVALWDEPAAWCHDNLTTTPSFEVDRFEICEDCFFPPQIPTTHLHLDFANDEDAVFFKMRWC